MTADKFGTGPQPEPKTATNKGEAKRDEERGWELLLAVLLGMGLREAFEAGPLGLQERMHILDAIVMETSASLTSTTRDLIAKKITARVWFLRMRDILVASSAAGALAILGKREFSDDERDAWVAEINGQYGYLVAFRDGIRDGTRLLGEVAVASSDLYARAIWSTSWRVLVASWLAVKRPGYRLMGERHLGFAEHCSGCLEEAAKPPMPLEDVLPLGMTVCGSRCHCDIVTFWVPIESNQ